MPWGEGGGAMAMKGCARGYDREIMNKWHPRLAPQHSIKAQASDTRPLGFRALRLHPVAV